MSNEPMMWKKYHARPPSLLTAGIIDTKVAARMSNYRFIQLDVFTQEAFAGNPLAVFPEAEGSSDEQVLKIAREMNLSETVFVLNPPAPPTESIDDASREANDAVESQSLSKRSVFRRSPWR